MAPRRPTDVPAEESLDAAALKAVDEAARAIAGLLDIEEALQLIVDRVRALVGARYAALGIVGPDDRIERFITSGMSHHQREAIGPLPRGRGLLGLIIRKARSYRIPNIAAHPDSSGFPAHHPPMTSFLGVPVTSQGRSVGNFYLTDKIGAPEFTPADQRLVELFALHAGIAMDNARLHQQAADLAIVQERDRIGRDLHDGIIQSLYAVSLSLEDVPEMMASSPVEAGGRVDAAAGKDVSPEQGAELLQLVRESLSNAARHARARHLVVTFHREKEGPTLVVADDGVGFDAAGPVAAGHNGLANMRARAEAIGATLRVESTRGEGTRIIVTLPSRAHLS